MEHPSDVELIEHAGGQLPAEHAGRVAEHLAACPQCRARFEEVRATYERLGDWQVAPPQADLCESVVAAARREPAPAGRTIRLSLPWWGRAARAAAAILLAAVLGHVLGRAVRPVPPPVDRRQVADAMYLDVLASDSPAGLSDSFLSLGQGGPQEVQP